MFHERRKNTGLPPTAEAENRTDEKKVEQILDDYREIGRRLSELQNSDDKGQLYVDLIELINQVADYVIPKDNPSGERIGEIMGGQILQLQSEKLREEGMKEGIKEGRILELYSMVQDGDISLERAAKRLGITAAELKNKMSVSGYLYPEEKLLER